VAKRDLKVGDRLDGVGGFCTYGLIDNTASARSMSALPIGLSAGCTIRREVRKDAGLSFDDIDSPENGLALSLWKEQQLRWPVENKDSSALIPAESYGVI
jgi:predicted homoserine dehydrogenase-like protein